MGIKDFYKMIDSLCPEELITLDLYDLSGMSIAVDISVFLYKLVKTAGDRWHTNFVSFLCTLKKYRIKCVCIFDGPGFPPEKIEERERRRAQSQKSIDRMLRCEELRELIRSEYIGPGAKQMPEELKEECTLLMNRMKGYIDMDKPGFICDKFTEIIDKLKKQTAPITPEHTEEAKEIVKALGLACYHSPGEAETLCAYLAIRGYVNAVLTEDTDVMAYGTPVMLAFKNFKPWEGKIHAMVLETILQKVEMNLDEFRDLCILLSCDYNSRAKLPAKGKGKKPTGIGVAKAINLIQQYRRIEAMEDVILDTTPLNYKRCRELFTIPAYEDVFNLTPYNRDPDYAELELLIEKYNIHPKVLDNIQRNWENASSRLIFESESDSDS